MDFNDYFRICIVPTLFYIYNGVCLAMFQRKEKSVLVVTLNVQTTVPQQTVPIKY